MPLRGVRPGLATCAAVAATVIPLARPAPAAVPAPDVLRGLAGQGYVFTRDPAPLDAQGRPRVFRADAIPAAESARLTPPMRSAIRQAVASVRPRYRSRVAFFFAAFPRVDQRYLVVFLDGLTQYPALNLCYRWPPQRCARYCPWYVTPRRTVVATSMSACEDHAPYRSG